MEKRRILRVIGQLFPFVKPPFRMLKVDSKTLSFPLIISNDGNYCKELLRCMLIGFFRKKLFWGLHELHKSR